MCGLKKSRVLSTCILVLVSSLDLRNFQAAAQGDCGQILDVEDDIRTRAPWTAQIFTRSQADLSYKYFVTGVILGPSTVLTLLGKTYGAPSRSGGHYKIPFPTDTIVVTGLQSNDLNDSDEFTQISQISYLLPNTGHSDDNKVFHFVLVHLRTPLDLTFPYVRSVCLNSGRRGSGHNQTELQLTGFTPLPGATSFDKLHLRVGQVRFGSKTRCDATFAKFYEGSPHHTFCGTIQHRNRASKDLCILLHGSPLVVEIGKRWYLKGLTALIPGKKQGSCDDDTVYYFAEPGGSLSWILQNIACGSNKFTCKSTGYCLSLSKVCDKNNDCPDNSDENEVFCRAMSQCASKNYQCGLHGLCIGQDRLCDGFKDCPDGSDEFLQICAAVRTENMKPKTVDLETVPCDDLQTFEGVVSKCVNSSGKAVDCSRANAGSQVTLTCDEQYRSSYRVVSVKMKCGPDGKWGPFKPFACEPECGHIGSGFQIQLTNGAKTTSEVAFPWYAAIFMKNEVGDYNFICGGSLIEQSAVITAAHCVTVDGTAPIIDDVELYKVVFAPISSNYSANVQDRFVQIKSVSAAFLPSSYNTKNLQSDIALLQLQTPVVFNDFVRPVCYLLPFFPNPPQPGSIGKIAGLGFDENKAISRVLKHLNFPVISNSDCFNALDRILPLNTFCAGYQNKQTAVCKGDSGGGLVFREPVAGSERYVIKGVVSHSDAANRLCDTENYSVFTHVDAFAEFIIETLNKINSR